MIIDVRLRPPYGGFRKQFKADGPAGYNAFTVRLGMTVPESVKQISMELMLQEMDEAGITMGVVPGRCNRNYSIPNEDIVELVDKYSSRFIGLAAIDPLTPVRESMDVIRKFVLDGPLTGVHFEPGGNYPAYFANDARYYPIYEFCQEHNVPLMVMLGGRAGPNIPLYTNPTILNQLALDFPGINWIITHGGWPWIQATLATCFWVPNIYLSPDLYIHTGICTPEYVSAANGFMQDRIIFGSAYPLMPLGESLEGWKALFRPEVLPKLLYKNAARLFNIKLPEEE